MNPNGFVYAQSKNDIRPKENPEIFDTVIQKLYAESGPFAKFKPNAEIVDKRTENSKYFKNIDGSFTAVMAAGPMHYKENGLFKTSSNEVINVSGTAGVSLANIHNAVKTFYGKDKIGFSLDQGNALLFLKPNGIALLNAQGQEMVNIPFLFTDGPTLLPSKSQSVPTTVLYANIDGSLVDFEIDQRTQSFKSQYIIKQKPSSAGASSTGFVAFTETLEFPFAVSYQLNTENGGKQHEFVKNGEVLVQISDAYLFDSHPNTRLEDLKVKVAQVADNAFEIQYVISLNWFGNPDRVYPVFVDPFVVFTPNQGTYWTGTTNEDCDAHSTDKMKVGFFDCSGCDDEEWTTYAKINTAGLPDNMCVNNANFYLYKDVWRDGDGNNQLQFDVGWLNLDPVPSGWCAIRDGLNNMPERYSRWDVWGTPGACGGCNGGWDFNEGHTGWYNFNVDYNLFRNRLHLTTGQDYFTIGLDNIVGNNDCGTCFWSETNEIEFRGWSSNERPRIEVTYTDLVSPATFGNNVWNVYGYSGQNWDLNGVIYKGYYTDGNVNVDTRNRYCDGCSPANASGWVGCDPGADYHTVVLKRQGFPCGNYAVSVPWNDDEARIFVNGSQVWSAGACCGPHGTVWNGYLGPFSTVEIRYAEGAGGNGVAVTFTPTGNTVQGNPSTFGSGVWNAYVWWAGDANGNGGAWTTNYSGYYTINALNFDTRIGQPYSTPQSWATAPDYLQNPSSAAGYQGCYVGPDNHSYAFKRQGFPCGYYTINLPNHDDRAVLFVNGVQVQDYVACCVARPNAWQGFLHGTSTIELRISEGGGGSHGSIELVKQYDLAINSSNAAMNCTDAARALTANVAGGTWSGPGVSGSSFNPATAGPGTHTITYTLNGCTATQQIAVSAPGNPNTFGINVWNTYVWNAGDALGGSGSWTNNYSGYYVINALSFDTRIGQTYSTPQSWGTAPDYLQSPSSALGYLGCTVNADPHSYAFKRQGFPCGYYQINLPNHDDRAVLFINGAQVQDYVACCATRTNAWQGFLHGTSTIELRIADGGAGSHGSIELVKLYDLAINSSNAAMNCTDAARALTANVAGGTWSGPGVSGSSFNPATAGPGTHTITYTLNGCTATQQIAVSAPGNPNTFGANVWNAYAWNAGDAFGTSGAWTNNYSGYYVIPSLNFDTRPGQTFSTAQSWANSPSEAAGYQGCTVAADYHSYAFKRQGFPCGFYQINLPIHDDRVMVYVNGALVHDVSNWTANTINIWQGFLHGTSTIEIRVSEGGGGSNGSVELVKLYDLAINSSNAAMNCTDAPRALIANVAGGTWSGTGVSGSSFNPATAGPGTHTITYTLNGCTATQQISVSAPGTPATFGNNQWNVYAYNAGNELGGNGAWTNNYSGYYTVSALSFDTRLGQTYSTAQSWANSPSEAAGYQGCTVGADNHSWTAKRTNFTCGLYRIVIHGHDDMAQLYVNGTKVFENLYHSASASSLLVYPYTAWMGELTTNSTVEFRASEGVGGSWGGIQLEQITNAAITATVTKTDVTCNGSNNGKVNLALSGGMSNARLIRITQKDNQFLNLAELQAFDLYGNNVALASGGATITATSTHASYPLTNLIDGNTTNFAHSGTVAENRGQYMEILLPSGAALDYIRIYNRTDCCQNRSANLLIEVFSDAAGTNRIFGKTVDASAPYPTPVTVNMLDLSWSNGATTMSQSNLSPGTYNVTVTNNAYCNGGNATGGATIGEPTDLSIGVGITNESCIGNSNGAINITPTGGTPNRGISLDGAGDYIDLPDAAYFTGSSFTVEAWVYPRSYASWSRIFDFGNGAGNQNVLLALSNGTSGVPLLDIYNGATAQALSANQAIPLNVWTHVAVVFNAGTATIYFNGNSVGSGAVLTPPNVVRTNNYIGKSNWADADANLIIDEFRIWSTAVSVANLNTYNCGASLLSHPNYANLQVHLAMNETNGTTVPDKANGSYNGTMVGNPTWAASSAVNYGCYSPGTGYAYNWSNGATTEDLGGLAAGSYNVTVKDGSGCTETGNYTITVTPAIANSISGGGPALCNYGDPTTMNGNITGGTGSYTIVWQQSTDGTNYSDISNTNSSSYDPGQITQTTWYRRRVVSGPCTSTSNAIQITVTYQTTITWTGAVSTNWHVDGNWDCGHVPTSIQDVVVPSAPVNQPEILSGNVGACNTINVQTGANLTVKGNGRLDVNP